MAKKAPRVHLVDTTFRDAQQSLLGGHLRGAEIVPIAAKMDAIGFAAMEAFGGATFETLGTTCESYGKSRRTRPSRR